MRTGGQIGSLAVRRTGQDVANFVLHAACANQERFRCLVILDQPTPESEPLLREMERWAAAPQVKIGGY
jgi:uncharacterized protein (DUF1778 family)